MHDGGVRRISPHSPSVSNLGLAAQPPPMWRQGQRLRLPPLLVLSSRFPPCGSDQGRAAPLASGVQVALFLFHGEARPTPTWRRGRRRGDEAALSDSRCAIPGRRRTSPVAVPVCRAINRPPAIAHTCPGWGENGRPLLHCASRGNSDLLQCGLVLVHVGKEAQSGMREREILELFHPTLRHNQG
ncbi:hypothetical protein EJB05_14527, partial [Eragrostis curvula]